MAEEEKAWHEQQSISDPSSNNQSPEEKSGENTLESKDDDITPGCYVLDIDNELIGIKRIWVRAEYIRIYDFLVEYYEEIHKRDFPGSSSCSHRTTRHR
ncbi:hypothetical protein DFH94DRAFT_700271 [Russula ochroleuca]|uniref:Uncharacterized protein n=1 Tax=Russula ochroleuca TaxID=152965 RepID=A0A9P5MMP3_9AGAM|nr:hypothetical protein DFH94DRAFT_700271 [Russula ochroleuca]